MDLVVIEHSPKPGHSIQEAALSSTRRTHYGRQVAILEHPTNTIQQSFGLRFANCILIDNQNRISHGASD